MTNTEHIQQILDMIDAPVCDDCLATRASVQSRQQVNQICHRLADRGDIDRETGRCTLCGKTKIVNSPIVNRNVPG